MMRQRKIVKNVGRDTHVRQNVGNVFKSQSSKTFQTLAGEISLVEPEPIFRQNMVNVKLAIGGEIQDVAYPGAFIDPITGNLHGTYEGPIPGQMVQIGFNNGNFSDPYVINRYPYQGSGDTLNEFSYINPLTKALFDSTDVMIGHFSGSYLSFNTGIISGNLPGSVTLKAMTDMNLESNTNMNLNSSTFISLNGNTNYAVKYTELKTAFDQLKTELNNFISVFNSHVHTGVTTGVGTSGASPTPGTNATADMSASQNLKVLM